MKETEPYSKTKNKHFVEQIVCKIREAVSQNIDGGTASLLAF